MYMMSKDEYKQEMQALNGSLFRIGATDDVEELKEVYVSVRKRLEKIYRYRYEKLNNKNTCAAAAEGTYTQRELFDQDK